jgi:rhodanese-related sulfurtransferase
MITTSVRELVDAANREIVTISIDEALNLHGHEDVVFVDIRDVRELHREGRITNAFHCPRDMLEFWIDPTSSYHKPIFASDKRFIFFCAGGFRSALAAQTASQMGLKPVAHLNGGFNAWKRAGGAVSPAERKSDKDS